MTAVWREELATKLFFGVAGAALLVFNSLLTTSRLSESLGATILAAMGADEDLIDWGGSM